MGFRSGDWDGHCITWVLFLQFCVDVCLESLSCWKSPYDQGNQIFCQDFLVPGVESIVPLKPLAEKHIQNNNDPTLYLTVGMRCFSLYGFHFAGNMVCMAKMLHFDVKWPSHSLRWQFKMLGFVYCAHPSSCQPSTRVCRLDGSIIFHEKKEITK